MGHGEAAWNLWEYKDEQFWLTFNGNWQCIKNKRANQDPKWKKKLLNRRGGKWKTILILDLKKKELQTKMDQHKWQNTIKKLPGGSNGWTKKFRMKNKHKIEQLFEKQISTINLYIWQTQAYIQRKVYRFSRVDRDFSESKNYFFW